MKTALIIISILVLIGVVVGVMYIKSDTFLSQQDEKITKEILKSLNFNFNLNAEIDPKEIEDRANKKINTIAYDEYGEEYKRHVVNNHTELTLYSGVKYIYEDGRWKDRAEARSFKNSSLKPTFLEYDKDTNLIVVDYNDTSITVMLDSTEKNLNKAIPITIWSKNESKITDPSKSLADTYKTDYIISKEEVFTPKLAENTKTITYPFTIGKSILEYGFNSTTVIINDSSTYNMGDSYVDGNTINTNYGTDAKIYVKCVDDLCPTSTIKRGMLKYNISMIPDNSINITANLTLYYSYTTVDTSNKVNIIPMKMDTNWSESTITWNNQSGAYPKLNGSISILNGTINKYINFTVSNILSEAYANNTNRTVAIILKEIYYDFSAQTEVGFGSKDSLTVAQRPVLYISYDIDPNYIIKPILPTENGHYNLTIMNFNISAETISISYCNISLDNSQPTDMQISNVIYANYTISNMIEGNHNVTYSCNSTDTVWYGRTVNNFIIDNTAPIINYIAPTPDDGSSTDNLNLTINATVTESFGIYNMTLNVNGSESNPIDKNLVLMMNFNNNSLIGESGLFVKDISSNNFTGRCGNVTGSCNYSAGEYGLGIGFNGKSTFINISNIGVLDKPLTFSAWINAKSSGALDGIISQYLIGLGYALYMDKGKVTFWRGTIGGNKTTSTSNITRNVWHHVVGTTNGSTMLLYIDGVLNSTAVESGADSPSSDDDLNIGSLDPTRFYFNGTIDEVIILNRSVSANEVQNMYYSNVYKYNNTQYNIMYSKNNLSLGTYNFSLTSCDYASLCTNNARSYSIVSFAGSPPVITEIFPTSNIKSNTTIMNFSISTNINVTYCGLSLDGAVNVTMNLNASNTGANYTNSTMADGNHNVTYSCNSTTNLWGYKIITSILVDTIKPKIAIIYPVNNTNYSSNKINVNYTRSDANLQSCWYSNDTFTVNISLTNCINITGITWSEGQHEVRIWVNDSLNNLNQTSVKFGVDTTAPSVSLITPTNYYNTTDNYIDFLFNGTDYGSGLYNWSLRIYNSSSYISYQDSALTGSVTYSEISSWQTLTPDGVYNWNITFCDNVGLCNSTASRYLTVDTTPPNINITNPIDQNYSIKRINFNVTINEAVSWCGLSLDENANITMTLNSSKTGANYQNASMTEGNHNVKYTCNDTLNNYNTTAIRNFYIDSKPPYFTNIANQIVADNVSFVYDIDATDDGLGVQCFSVNQTTNFKINCSGGLTNKTTLTAGIYNLNVTVNDTLNNKNYSVFSVNVTNTTIISSDTTAPMITFSTPTTATGTYYNRTSIDVNATGSDLNWANMTVTLSNSSGTNLFNLTFTTGRNILLNYTNLAWETYHLNAYGYDTSTNRGDAIERVIDLTNISTVSTPVLQYHNFWSSDKMTKVAWIDKLLGNFWFKGSGTVEGNLTVNFLFMQKEITLPLCLPIIYGSYARNGSGNYICTQSNNWYNIAPY